MILERISARGFLGLKNLTVGFDQSTVLIGENGWGKSSVYRLLTRVLGGDKIPCRFTAEDFRNDPQDDLKAIDVVLSFRERKFGQAKHSAVLSQFSPYWVKGNDDLFHIYYHIRARFIDGVVRTSHFFTDMSGKKLKTKLRDVRKLVMLNPAYMLRDTRMDKKTRVRFQNSWEKKISDLAMSLSDPQSGSRTNLPKEQVVEGLEALNYIISSYLPEFHDSRLYKRRSAREIASNPISLHGMGSLQTMLSHNSSDTMKFIMIILQHEIMAARGNRIPPRVCFPIVLLEDIESRLHPSYLMMFMSILNQMPFQRIISTNSGDLLTCQPLSAIRRMVRTKDGSVLVHQASDALFSNDDLRRLAFHVRIGNPMAMFARTWLLVEGETEIWLINQLAEIVGINLLSEGIRTIAFAQCGAAPLIRFAKQMGINWHLLADGDQAGVKYCRLANNFLAKGQDAADHVTKLPSADIEHYLYEHGFENVYRHESGYGFTQAVSEGKIIERAVHRRSKPGLAINIVEQADRNGPDSVPDLFKGMFLRLTALSRESDV